MKQITLLAIIFIFFSSPSYGLEIQMGKDNLDFQSKCKSIAKSGRCNFGNYFSCEVESGKCSANIAQMGIPSNLDVGHDLFFKDKSDAILNSGKCLPTGIIQITCGKTKPYTVTWSCFDGFFSCQTLANSASSKLIASSKDMLPRCTFGPSTVTATNKTNVNSRDVFSVPEFSPQPNH